jgi:hypothetical protein
MGSITMSTMNTVRDRSGNWVTEMRNDQGELLRRVTRSANYGTPGANWTETSDSYDPMHGGRALSHNDTQIHADLNNWRTVSSTSGLGGNTQVVETGNQNGRQVTVTHP